MERLKRTRPYYFAGAAILLGASFVFTTAFAYLTRYSQFDGSYGVIDDRLYFKITRMFPAERLLGTTGLVLIGVGVVVALAAFIMTSSGRRGRG